MNVNGATGSNADYSRITGLATGMDTDGMVNKAIAGDKMRIEQAKQNKQAIEWQQEAYVGMIKDLKDFYNSYLDILAPADTNMMTSAAYSGFKAESSDTNKLSVNAYGGALKGTYTMNITQLAEGAKAQTDALADGTTLKSKLSSIDSTISSGQLKFTVKGKEFTVDVKSDSTIEDFIKSVRDAKNGTDVLGNYININFSELTKKLTIESKDTGSSEIMEISDVTGNLAEKLGINYSYQGKNAKVAITPPGESSPVTVEKPTNNFTIDNINYNLVGGNAGDTVTVNVKPDATDKVEKFKKFIEKYNSLIENINKKVTEKKDYKYKPLTDDQKKDMKDDEIKNWEEKAKQGMLSRDNNLSNLLLQTRQIFYTAVKGAGLSAQDIGIETTSNWRDGGKLKLDENKLKTALETKGDQVQKLFTQSGDKDEKGILQRLKDTFNQYIGSDGLLVKKAGYENTRWAGSNDLSKSIEQRNKIIKDLETKMYSKQERYYKLFAALEKNMNSLNSQSNWLASQLGAR